MVYYGLIHDYCNVMVDSVFNKGAFNMEFMCSQLKPQSMSDFGNAIHVAVLHVVYPELNFEVKRTGCVYILKWTTIQKKKRENNNNQALPTVLCVN